MKDTVQAGYVVVGSAVCRGGVKARWGMSEASGGFRQRRGKVMLARVADCRQEVGVCPCAG